MGPVSKLFVTEVRLYLYSSDQRCLFVFSFFVPQAVFFIIYYLKFDIFFSFNLDAPKSHLFFYVYVICLFWLMFFFFFSLSDGNSHDGGKENDPPMMPTPSKRRRTSSPPEGCSVEIREASMPTLSSTLMEQEVHRLTLTHSLNWLL